MERLIIVRVLAVVAAVLLAFSLVTEAEISNSAHPLGPPDRPLMFHSPKELRDYLQALNEYFAIVGRPRFGRSVSKRSISGYKRSLLYPSFLELDLNGDGYISPVEIAFALNLEE